MGLWTMWLDVVRSVLHMLTTEAGLGLGFAIIVTTLLLRTALLPISWTAAYRGCVRQKKMKRLQPELARLKKQFADRPDEYTRRMVELYRRHGLSLLDGRSMVAAFAQMPVFIGMYHVLRKTGQGVRFLWIPNLIKPNTVLAIIAGITTALVILANPDMPEHVRLLMIAIPSIVAMISALHFCSALALYWTASNCFSMTQTFALHFVVGRRIRSGTLRI